MPLGAALRAVASPAAKNNHAAAKTKGSCKQCLKIRFIENASIIPNRPQPRPAQFANCGPARTDDRQRRMIWAQTSRDNNLKPGWGKKKIANYFVSAGESSGVMGNHAFPAP